MSAWQYAQLTIRLEGHGGEDSCTILWHGPGQGLGENFSGSGKILMRQCYGPPLKGCLGPIVALRTHAEDNHVGGRQFEAFKVC